MSGKLLQFSITYNITCILNYLKQNLEFVTMNIEIMDNIYFNHDCLCYNSAIVKEMFMEQAMCYTLLYSVCALSTMEGGRWLWPSQATHRHQSPPPPLLLQHCSHHHCRSLFSQFLLPVPPLAQSVENKTSSLSTPGREKQIS